MMSLIFGKVIRCANKFYNTLNNLYERRAEKIRNEEEEEDQLYYATEYQSWQLELINALSEIDHTDKQHDISYLLEEPHKQPEYTLDFVYSLHNDSLGLSSEWEQQLPPLSLAVEKHCSSCVVKLLDAGATVDVLDIQQEILTPIIRAVHVLGNLHRDNDEEGTKKVRQIAKELLRRGANVHYVINVLNEYERVWRNSAMEFAIAPFYHSPDTLQMLLDNEADLADREAIPLYWTPVFRAVRNNRVGPLRVCLDHAEKNNVNISIDSIFEMLTSKYQEDYLFGKCSNRIPSESVELILRRGYIPDKTSIHVRSFFCKLFQVDKYAQTTLMELDLFPMPDKDKIILRSRVCKRLKEELVKADKLMLMMLDLSPMLLQACRDQLDGESRFSTLIENPPSLQSLCKGAIVSRMGHLYLEKVKQLKQDLTGPTLRLLRSVVEETEYLAKLY